MLSLFKKKTPSHDKNAIPRISVIIPCYNHGKFLAEAVESVVRQTFSNWEIIIVDDGSTDESATIATALQNKFSNERITVLSQPNGGLSNARNAGVRRSRGEYFLPLDADDKLTREALAELFTVLENNPDVGFSYPRLRHFGVGKRMLWGNHYDREKLFTENILPYCALIKKEVWEVVSGYDETLCEGYEDWNFWLSCAENNISGVYVDKTLLLYRKHLGGSMLSRSNEKRELIIELIVKRHPKLYSR